MARNLEEDAVITTQLTPPPARPVTSPVARPPVRPKRARGRFSQLSRRIRNAVIGLIGPWILRLWMGSIRYRWCGAGLGGPAPRGEGNCIYVLWHQRLLAFIYTHRGRSARALISKHSDGELISRVTEGMGFKAVRGSSSRGGMRAMLELLGESASGTDYAIVADGPRGPRYEFKPGAIFLACRIGLPIVPITISFDRFWQFRSWDRFILPRPFCRALIQVGEEIRLPPDLSSAETEIWQREIGETLKAITSDTDARFEELYRGATSDPFRKEARAARRLESRESAGALRS